MLCGLDWLVAECCKRGLRLLLVLTNYWPDYGGMQQYVRYAAFVLMLIKSIRHRTMYGIIIYPFISLNVTVSWAQLSLLNL